MLFYNKILIFVENKKQYAFLGYYIIDDHNLYYILKNVKRNRVDQKKLLLNVFNGVIYRYKT